jgi:CRISPR/Cas system CMR subunit Cmr4 (Cas7 group RAMP superfamily)
LHRWYVLSGNTLSKVFIALEALLAHDIYLNEDDALGAEKADGAPLDAALRVMENQYCLENRVLNARLDSDKRKSLGALAGTLADNIFPKNAPLRRFFSERLLLLSDETFSQFVQHATVIEANIEILDTGCTEDGSLRYTEYLPTETILAGYVSSDERLAGGEQANVAALLRKALHISEDTAAGAIQLGADETKGKGMVSVILESPAPPARQGE